MPRYKPTKVDWLIEAIKLHKSNKCLIWPYAKGKDGYGNCYFKKRTHKPHRVAFYLTRGHWPTPIARHTCDTPLCFNPRHVIKGTQAENISDMFKRGRAILGTKHWRCKLTNNIVIKIRKKAKTCTYTALAIKFGVSITTIGEIVNRKTWIHI